MIMMITWYSTEHLIQSFKFLFRIVMSFEPVEVALSSPGSPYVGRVLNPQGMKLYSI